ncbi:hypothetical protein CMV_021090 [Castanea mollissima]|uniref:Uncharacterized protein n=1 Tax=Castanea mollissima TaxID=60419 RepID=A0A8J4VCZ7_9ROSI|nr:hypothetical protein CMV_021090 [Castanea mollissima]
MQQESKHGVGKPQAQPRALRVNPVQFREALEKVKEIGFNPFDDEVCQGSTCYVANEVDVFKKWGWSEAEHEISLAFRRHPWCMMVLKDKSMRVMDFLVNKMGMESSVIMKYSELGKAIDYYGFGFQVLLSRGLVKKDFKMYTCFVCSEKTFMQKFVMPHEEVSVLLKL